MTVAVDRFREGMRRLAASVNILTTSTDDGERFGMTATAVCSVSGDPPTLLCCINRDNQTRDAIVGAGRFAVNVLAASDEPLANRFAMRMTHAERFEQGAWAMHELGLPVLETAAAWFACQIVTQVEVGSHTIFFGEVADVASRGAHVLPLLYANGGYGKFSDAQPTLNELMWTPDWQVNN